MTEFMDSQDPELLELLAEVALDDRSKLFRTDPGSRKQLLYPDASRVRPTSPWLSAAERHLLATHREEVARLLYSLASRMLVEDPTFGSYITRSYTIDRELTIVDPDDWRRRARVSDERLRGATGELRDCQDLINRLCAKDGRATPRELLESCMRLLPSDRARVCLAVDEIRQGSHERATQLLTRILEDEPASMIASHAWTNIGLIEMQSRQFDKAVTAYEAAADASNERATPLVGMLVAALQNGQRGAAVRAASQLTERVPPSHPGVRADIDQIKAARVRGRWTPTPAAWTIIGSAKDSLGDVGNEVVRYGFQED